MSEDKESSTGKKINEVRKKISLCEGKRRAFFHTVEKEKNLNKEKTFVLQDELKSAKQSLISSDSTKDNILRKIPSQPHLDKRLYGRFSPDSAVNVLDYRVSELQRRLNKLRSKNKNQANYLNLLLSESNKIKEDLINEGKILIIPEEQQRQRFLENEIHKISLKMMEGEMVRKKYDVIHDMLKKEQVHYSRQQQQLDEVFKTQLKEVEILQKDMDEAVHFRDDLRNEVKDWEKKFSSMQKERIRELTDKKKYLKEKQDLYGNIDTYLLRSEGVKTLSSSTSTISMDYMYDKSSGSASTIRDVSEYAEAFDQMKRAAGVEEIDDVIDRFKTQGKTAELLEIQNDKAKSDVMKLSEEKEELQECWEKVRYLGQSEDRAINDKCVDIGYDIEDAEERKQNASNETQMISSIDKKVRSSLHDLASILVEDDVKHKSTLAVLSICKEQIELIFDRVGGEDIEIIREEMMESDFRPAETTNGDTFKEDEERRRRRALKPEEDDGLHEEDEIPSNQSIKRQSEMMVTARQQAGTDRRQRR